MLTLETVTSTPGKMEARKEVRMHRADEERIRVRQLPPVCKRQTSSAGPLCSARRKSSNACPCPFLPVEAFEAFKAAVEAPGRKVPSLARAAKAMTGLLKDAG